MKALQLLGYGRSPVMAEIGHGAPGPDEVQVKIAACGLNFADLLTISGQYQEKPELPHTLGMELAGVVTATGTDVTNFRIGDRIAAYAGGGGLAEAGVFPANRCVHIPDTMPFDVAAGFLVAYGTSHLALTERADLSKGETLVVLGASGGVGLTAVELGALLGARVIAIARGDEKLAIARQAGASLAFESDDADLKTILRDLGGVDVVYDAVGDPLFSEVLRATKPGARVLAIGFAGGQVPQIPANYLLVKNLSVHGFYWGAYAQLDPQAMADSLGVLFRYYANGQLHPHISHVLPLDRANEGLDLLRARKSTGKVVIRIDHAA